MIGLLLHRGKIAEVIQLLGNFTLMASSKSEGWKFKISGPNVLIRACLKSIPSIFKLTSAPEKKGEDTYIAYIFDSFPFLKGGFWSNNFCWAKKQNVLLHFRLKQFTSHFWIFWSSTLVKNEKESKIFFGQNGKFYIDFLPVYA